MSESLPNSVIKSVNPVNRPGLINSAGMLTIQEVANQVVSMFG